MILGLPLLWWSLLGSFGLIAVGFFALMHLADRADTLRRASLVPISPLPVALAIPAKWRRRNNKLSTNPNQGN